MAKKTVKKRVVRTKMRQMTTAKVEGVEQHSFILTLRAEVAKFPLDPRMLFQKPGEQGFSVWLIPHDGWRAERKVKV